MSQENVELVRSLFGLWAQRDYARAADFIDPEIDFVRVGELGDLAGEWRGITEAWTAIVEYLRAWDDLRQEPERFIDLGDRVLVLLKHVGRGRGSGALVEHDVTFMFTLSDAKVVRLEAYWDRDEAMRAAGLAR